MFKLNEQQQAILEQAQVILTKVMEEFQHTATRRWLLLT